ncbi:MAG: NADH-quinone oxidoreductase subunit M [Acidobacteriaceae bacterium]
MLNASILTWLTFLPVAGAVVVLLLPRHGRAPQIFTLIFTLCLFVLALHLPAHFDYHQHGFQFELNVPWVSNPAIRYHVGVDGLSLWLVVLVSFLAPLGVLISWRAIQDRKSEFYALFLLQQTAMYGVFVALDLILYYAFWELSIVPLALLIGMYGRTTNGRRAAIKFFLYAFIPSALLLVGMIWLYSQTGTFDFVQLQQQLRGWSTGPHATGLWLASLAFLVAFAVKVPVFPLHGWLRDGLSEAPTAVMMILAGKLGLYSLLRFHVELFPTEAAHVALLMVALATIGVLYGALMALVQTDLKRLAAYATLSAVSFVVLGIYAFTVASMDGAAYQILNESISASAFFMLLAILYERYGTYDMARLGGVAAKMPQLATLFVITMLALIGLPSLGNFVGEFLILSGSFQTHPRIASAATVGVILSAAYMLWMIQRVFYGAPAANGAVLTGTDVNWRERAAVWPTIAMMILLGVASVFWMKAIDLSVPSAVFRNARVVMTFTYNKAPIPARTASTR